LLASKLVKNNLCGIKKPPILQNLDFDVCPIPSSIIWENRTNKPSEKMRKAIAWIVFIILFAASITVCALV
jgi:hypothetical protein